MQQENDFIEREIQRLNLLLAKLVARALGIKVHSAEKEMQSIENNLKKEFDLNLTELSTMEDLELKERLKEWHEEHLEKLAALIVNVVENENTRFGKQLACKGIVILEYLDSVSKTFSMKRMQLKRNLTEQKTS